MEREAIINPHTIGTLEAYRQVIFDISRVLQDPAIDMGKLFYAVMIQSGVKRFRVPEEYIVRLPSSSLLSNRVSGIDYSRVGGTLDELSRRIFAQVARSSLSQADRRLVNELVVFLYDLYVAAAFRRPVVSVVEIPKLVELRPLLKEDLYTLTEALLTAVETLSLDAPVARFEVQTNELESFQAVMSSDVFDSYVDSHSALQLTLNPTSTLTGQVSRIAHGVVDVFPGQFDLRKTAVGAIQAVPAILDATVGKIFGALAKPLTSALAGALGGGDRLLVYSFHPTWRQIWGGKLDKVRSLLREESKASRVPKA